MQKNKPVKTVETKDRREPSAAKKNQIVRRNLFSPNASSVARCEVTHSLLVCTWAGFPRNVGCRTRRRGCANQGQKGRQPRRCCRACCTIGGGTVGLEKGRPLCIDNGVSLRRTCLLASGDIFGGLVCWREAKGHTCLLFVVTIVRFSRDRLVYRDSVLCSACLRRIGRVCVRGLYGRRIPVRLRR